MRIVHQWNPPEGVQHNRGSRYAHHQIGTELAFPMMTKTSRQNGAVERINFGLWVVDPTTGTERAIEAPFYLEQERIRLMRYSFRIETIAGSELIFSIERKGSYDLQYNLVGFDGSKWTQALFKNKAQQLVHQDLEFQEWKTPGLIELEPPLLVGGRLAVAHNPLTFAVDFTHAFSYDNGPESPEAQEFLNTQKRAQQHPRLVNGFRNLTLNGDELKEVVDALPRDHPVHEQTHPHLRVLNVPEGMFVRHQANGPLNGLTLLAR